MFSFRLFWLTFKAYSELSLFIFASEMFRKFFQFSSRGSSGIKLVVLHIQRFTGIGGRIDGRPKTVGMANSGTDGRQQFSVCRADFALVFTYINDTLLHIRTFLHGIIQTLLQCPALLRRTQLNGEY